METKNIDEIKAEVLPEDTTKHDLSFKIIIIGDPGVGKSCLTAQAVKEDFYETYKATIGFDFQSFNVKLDDVIVKLQIWDTCGQEIYKSLISSFYKSAALAMIVYSIDSKESFQHLDSWLKDVQLQSNPDIKIFLIGNKVDLEEEREVSFEEAKEYSEEHNFNYVNETSAKTGFNAKNVFIQAAKVLYLEYLKYKSRANKTGNTNTNNTQNINMKVSMDKENKRNQGGCC